MTCGEVREHLAERSLGLLDASLRPGVDDHLRGCAACGREAADLEAAAAQVGLAAATDVPPAALEDRIVGAVRDAAGAMRRGPRVASRRTVRTTVVLAVAASVVVAVLGFGAAMAGRAERYAVRASRAEDAQADALERFRRVLSGAMPAAEFPTEGTRLGQLAPVLPGGVGGGAVLQLVSDSKLDFTIVIVRGLGGDEGVALPLTVRLRNLAGEVLRAGVIADLSPNGRGSVFHEFRRDLSTWSRVEVVDADGRVVLAGAIGAGA